MHLCNCSHGPHVDTESTPDGDYVLASDYDALREEVELLREEVELLKGVVAIAGRIDGIASGEEWWCDELAAALDALQPWRAK
jgi:hypothetical protein